MSANSSSRKLPTISRLGVVFLTWRRHLQRQLLPYGITLKQEFVLHQLMKEPFLYPADIAEMLFCDRPTATVIIKNLEKQGWVQRRRDPDNQKFIQIILTPAGRAKVNELDQIPADDFDPLECLTREEREQLDSILKKIHVHLEQYPTDFGPNDGE
jgi:DNA-binding MarR family transcriptional regulator